MIATYLSDMEDSNMKRDNNELNTVDDGLVYEEYDEYEEILYGNEEEIFNFEKFWQMNFSCISNYKLLLDYVSDKKTVKE